jgi:phosphotriesterase-related protein
VLESVGVRPERVAVGHVCCLDDRKAEIAQRIAKRGAFVGFDRVTMENVGITDADRVVMVMALVEAGFADHLLLSSDGVVEANLKRNGGYGWARTVTEFGPKLLKAGLAEATFRRIVIENPRRFLAFVPPSQAH